MAWFTGCTFAEMIQEVSLGLLRLLCFACKPDSNWKLPLLSMFPHAAQMQDYQRGRVE